MSNPWPIFCAYGDGRHPAAYRVEGRWREIVVCLEHLPKAKRWAGVGAQVDPLQGQAPPPEQAALF